MRGKAKGKSRKLKAKGRKVQGESRKAKAERYSKMLTENISSNK